MVTIKYNPAGVFLPEQGITPAQLAALARPLLEARDEVLADAQLWTDGVEVGPEKQPLDAGFHLLPDRLLQELHVLGEQSEVGRIKKTADRLAAELSSVVVLGIGGSYMGARALLEACCHPFYNEVAPTLRNNRPRMYFEGNNVDNDAVHGLLDLLQSDSRRWGIAVISKSGGTLETAAALRIFLRELAESVGSDPRKLADSVVPVTGKTGKLADLSAALGAKKCTKCLMALGAGSASSVRWACCRRRSWGSISKSSSPAHVAMNEHFAHSEPGQNVVLDYVGVCHLMETERGCTTRILSTWGKRLEAFGFWYDQLLAESIGKAEQGALPLTVVNTRDLHSRGQQHQEGVRDKLITNVVVEQPGRPPLEIGASDRDQDGLNSSAHKTLPNVLSAALAGTNQAYREDNRPTADLIVPKLDEFVMGQLLQMMMLATVLEGRLIGINPYGQPGVEAYKKNMNAILRG